MVSSSFIENLQSYYCPWLSVSSYSHYMNVTGLVKEKKLTGNIRKPWVFPIKYRGFHGFSMGFPVSIFPGHSALVLDVPLQGVQLQLPDALHLALNGSMAGVRCSMFRAAVRPKKKHQQTSATHLGKS